MNRRSGRLLTISKSEAQAYIKRLLDEKIIEPQREVLEWCSLGFFMCQRGSNKPQFVIDYQRLNAMVLRPHWAFMSADEVSRALPGRGGYGILIVLKMDFIN